MVKQLTIICSSELTDMVFQSLSSAGIEGFAHLEGAGTKVKKKKSAYSHDLTWPADIFIIPADESLLRPIIDRLKAYAGKCTIDPCLKLILASVDEMH